MYMGEQRSIRIRRRSTTIRLELPFWSVLEEAAKNYGISLSALVTRLDADYRTADEQRYGERNLASCLRVFCLRYRGQKSAFYEVMLGGGLHD